MATNSSKIKKGVKVVLSLALRHFYGAADTLANQYVTWNTDWMIMVVSVQLVHVRVILLIHACCCATVKYRRVVLFGVY